jgi:hypothetical protein
MQEFPFVNTVQLHVFSLSFKEISFPIFKEILNLKEIFLLYLKEILNCKENKEKY